MHSVKELETWYHNALQVPEEERETYITRTLTDAPDLKKAILELLEEEKAEKSALTQLAEQLQERENITDIPKLDRYTVIEELGRGGMAIVYLAERTDGLFEQKVAIKVLKKGMDSEDILRRFNQEKNFLAQLDHASIASIFDAGTTESGSPFFVMEYIDGQPVTDYFKSRDVGFKKRLTVFLKVCKAVEFAHQNLILHRDIKPSNILINAAGEVKLTDFGIARLLNQDARQDITLVHQRLLTPEYASPEQVANENLDVRSDVYQLGKVLNKLIKDKDPPEMRLIAQHASHPEKSLRYNSVAALIEDIERFLDDKPIKAREISLFKKSQLFVKRNRVPVALASLFVSALIAITTIYFFQINRARIEAENERFKAEQSLSFLIDIFKQSDPAVSNGDTLSIGYVLAEGIETINQIREPETKASILNSLGEIQTSLGNFKEAEQLFLRASYIFDSLKKKNELGAVLLNLGKLNQEQSLLEDSQDYLYQALSHSTRGIQKARIFVQLAYNYDHSMPDSARIYKSKALSQLAKTEIPEADAVEITYQLQNIGFERLNEQETDSVIALKEKIVAEFETDHRENLTVLARFYEDLTNTYKNDNQYEKSVRYGKKAVSLKEKLYGSNNIRTASALYLLANAYGWSGQYDSAIICAQKALTIKESFQGELHPNQLQERELLALCLINDNQPQKGEVLLRENVKICKKEYGLISKYTGDNLFSLLQHLNYQGKYKESVNLYPDLIKIDSATYGMTGNTAASYIDFANALWKLGRITPALNKIDTAIEIYLKDEGPEVFAYGMAVFTKAKILKNLNPSSALTLMDSALVIIENGMPQNHPRIGNYQHQYARLLEQESYDSLSNAYYTKAIANYRINYLESSPHRVAKFEVDYAKSLIEQSMSDSAQMVLEKALGQLKNVDHPIAEEIASLLSGEKIQ